MSGVQQLLDMGVSRGKAKAALAKAKGDVNEAATFVISGDLDHVPDDDDGDDEESGVDAPSAMTSVASGSGRRNTLPTPEAEDAPIDDENEDENEDSVAALGYDEDDDMIDDDPDDYDDLDMSDDSDEFEDLPSSSPGSGRDPYAAIFFSKNRREEIIEVDEIPGSYSINVAGEQETGELLMFGEWMSGCPEKGEQGYLFNLWQDLAENPVTCECGQQTWERKKSDFFLIFPYFADYLTHVRSLIRKRCSSCHEETCFACGERIGNHGPHGVDAEGKGKAKATSNADVSSDDLNNALFHCASTQGALLGVGLIMVTRLFAEVHGLEHYHVCSGTDSPISRPAQKKRRTGSGTTKKAAATDESDDEDEAPYLTATEAAGRRAKGGTGYSGAASEDRSGQKIALAQQCEKDSRLGYLLKSVRVFLPNIRREGGGKPSDYHVHITTLAHVRRRFNTVASLLLRNDSITDMCDREQLYFEMFEWLETISRHEALCSAMAMPQMTRISSAVSKLPTATSRSTERTVVYEGGPGPRELLENLVIQATAAKRGFQATLAKEKKAGGGGGGEVEMEEMSEELKRMSEAERSTYQKALKKEVEGSVDAELSQENEKLLMFCNRIIDTAKAIDRAITEQKGADFVRRLHDSLPKIGSSAGKEAPSSSAVVLLDDSDEEIRMVYESWTKSVRFEYCDLTVPAVEGQPVAYAHVFSKDIVAMTSTSLPKRVGAIAKELGILSTNIPSGLDGSIFVRVDEDRVDVLKALIIGPADTPYENGCFLFDIHLPASYNTSPPHVKTMTTAGGTQRLNPNLYAEGKVCLSLLGTWSGPGWVAGQSTLLQVLISIQAMILNDEPYLNEPGWASSGGSPNSIAYTKNVRRLVVFDAMLNSLRNPPFPFENVIRTHFRLKSRMISKQLDKWLAEDDGNKLDKSGMGRPSPGRNNLAEHVSSIKDLLGKLERREEL